MNAHATYGRFVWLAVPALMLSVHGCASRQPASSLGAETARGSGIVLPREHFVSRAGTLLTSLTGHLPGMRVTRNAGSRCPAITFRGTKTFISPGNAGVYVDSSPVGDTCILDQIRASDVERVEVYPGGFAPTPGFRPDPNGLILVFTSFGDRE